MAENFPDALGQRGEKGKITERAHAEEHKERGRDKFPGELVLKPADIDNPFLSEFFAILS